MTMPSTLLELLVSILFEGPVMTPTATRCAHHHGMNDSRGHGFGVRAGRLIGVPALEGRQFSLFDRSICMLL